MSAIVLALTFPFMVGAQWQTIGNLALIYVVAAVGLMVLSGFAGQISLGHAAFLALGGYTAAILGNRYQIPWWLIVPLGGCVSAIVGVGISFFALRLRGLYLAIVTIGLLYMVHHVLHSLPSITGGSAGISVPIYTWFGETKAESMEFYSKMAYGPVVLDFSQKLYYWFLLIAAGCVFMAKNLTRSNAGRAMMAVRDQDMAADALGINPTRTKIAAFAISSFFGGVAGVMFAMQQQYLTVDPFHLGMSVEFIAMIVIGGVGTVFGAVAGALLFALLVPLAQIVGSSIPYLETLPSAQQSTVLFSLLVCFVLITEPAGLLGIWLRVKRYFQTWPFRY
ncbi:MAG: branched-chain amino acid ABC transporter permease [Kofleriaceae bacterium]|nr:branched-chain amino acid ABC transporter permease [Kofleriaceae bacterium]